MRGDIYRLRSDRNAKGREQRGARYGVVLQADYLPLGTVIVAPTTTNTTGANFWPQIDIDGTASFVIVEQLMAVDSSRLSDVAGRLSLEEQELVDDRIRDVLGL